MGTFFGGLDCVQDPGGVNLLEKARIQDASSLSYIIIRGGRGALCQIDGEWSVITEPGRQRLPSTGIWTFFPGVQNVISKGVPTHANEFYFFDTDPNVYRDIQFQVDDLVCVDTKTQLQVKCRPTVNVSLRIEEPFAFFKALLAYNMGNDAVGRFMHNRVAPWVKNNLYSISKTKPVIDVNAEEIYLAQDVEVMLRDLLSTFGLRVNHAQIISLGISQDSLKKTEEYYEAFSEASRDAGKIKIIADSVFGGDMEKAVRYVMMSRGLSKDVGFNPILWKMMEDFLKNGSGF